MLPADRRRLFEPAFATFKAFDNLTVASCSWEQLAFPATIWQILQRATSSLPTSDTNWTCCQR